MTDALESSLSQIESELQKVTSNREKILKESRDIIAASSRAIVFLHTGKPGEAEGEILKAKAMLAELKTSGQRGSLSRYLISPEAEFVEASTIQSIVSGGPVPPASSLDVSPEAYLLGLLDSVGEIKRLLLDAIMEGDVDRARGHFQVMERLYMVLSPFAVFDNVVGGLRRKIDVARMITEDTRGVLAEDARRGKLVSAIRELEEKLNQQHQPQEPKKKKKKETDGKRNRPR